MFVTSVLDGVGDGVKVIVVVLMVGAFGVGLIDVCGHRIGRNYYG